MMRGMLDDTSIEVVIIRTAEYLGASSEYAVEGEWVSHSISAMTENSSQQEVDSESFPSSEIVPGYRIEQFL